MRNVLARGFTLIELLVAIGVVMLIVGVFASLFLSEAEKRTCISQLQTVEQAALAARANPDDQLLCRNARALTEKFNADCGKKLAVLQLIECK